MAVFMLLAAQLVVSAAASSTLLNNPNFEAAQTFPVNVNDISGTMVSGGWQDNTDWATGVSLRYAPQAGADCGGTFASCLRIGILKGFAQFGQFLAVPVGTYRLGIWARAQLPAGSGQSTATVQLTLRRNGEPYAEFGTVTADVGASWVQLVVPAAKVPNDSGGGDADVFFVVNAAGPATLWLAQASLESQGGALASLLTNAQLTPDGLHPVNADGVDDNGGKIAGSLPGGWKDNSAWAAETTDVRIQYSVLTGAACQGKANCVRAAIAGTFSQWGQYLSVPANAAYRLSIWARAVPVAGSPLPGAVVSLNLRRTGDPYERFGQVSALVKSSWQQLYIDYAYVPPGADSFFVIQAGGPATVYFANATLVQLGAGVTRKAVSLTPPTQVVPREYFGMHANNLWGDSWWPDENGNPGMPGKLAYAWPALDFGLFRTWDSGVAWHTIQRDGPGKFNWTFADYLIQQANKRQQKVLFTLGQSPRWASSRPNQPSTWGNGVGAPPKSLLDWTTFVRALARRYKGRIHAYEVWNEPDLQGQGGFYDGTPAELVALEKAAAAVLAQEDPAALLLTAPMSAGDTLGTMAWLASYLAAGGGRLSRGVAWHAYVDAPEQAAIVMPVLRQVLAAYGLDRLPIWNSEGGLWVDGVSETSAAGFVARTLVLQWGLRMQASCWYAYDNRRYYHLEGLNQGVNGGGDANRLDAAGKAYRQMMAWMVGARMTSIGSRTDGIWVAQLQRGAGSCPSRSWIVWLPAGTTSTGTAVLALPAAWGAAYWQDAITGAKTQLRSSAPSVTVGEVPLLVAAAGCS